ncbi:uncharacterized protein LOC111392994 [Olea europaea var. sylvestris]|uniref:uncharacterized protein LOC111392994 n=1 Tax=Olea europaea var. sylvestris TaxID=158386 RepID=UPI000C1CF205|nr:uncharacterized protein LOC111392994 [Olea europaea var. sylvestris]
MVCVMSRDKESKIQSSTNGIFPSIWRVFTNFIQRLVTKSLVLCIYSLKMSYCSINSSYVSQLCCFLVIFFQRPEQYRDGARKFGELARENLNSKMIGCPCIKYINLKHHNYEIVYEHLIIKCMDPTYTDWLHGAELSSKTKYSCVCVFLDLVYVKGLGWDSFEALMVYIFELEYLLCFDEVIVYEIMLIDLNEGDSTRLLDIKLIIHALHLSCLHYKTSNLFPFRSLSTAHGGVTALITTILGDPRYLTARMSYNSRTPLMPVPSRKRKEREAYYNATSSKPLVPVTAVNPVVSSGNPTTSFEQQPICSNRLLAGYMAYEFLTKGTLLGERFDPARTEAVPVSSADSKWNGHGVSQSQSQQNVEAEPKPQSYAEVASLLKGDGAHIPGILNPTQLAGWIQM